MQLHQTPTFWRTNVGDVVTPTSQICFPFHFHLKASFSKFYAVRVFRRIFLISAETTQQEVDLSNTIVWLRSDNFLDSFSSQKKVESRISLGNFDHNSKSKKLFLLQKELQFVFIFHKFNEKGPFLSHIKLRLRSDKNSTCFSAIETSKSSFFGLSKNLTNCKYLTLAPSSPFYIISEQR